jgi:hypothetical protein
MFSAARWLVRRYPGPWRHRYEDEMLALLDEAEPGWRDVIDLARGLAVERARALFEPGDRPWFTFWLVISGRLVLAAGLMLVSILAGRSGRSWIGELPRWLYAIGPLTVLACALVLYVRLIPPLMTSTTPRERAAAMWRPLFPPRAAAVWVCVAFAGILLTAWNTANTFPWLLHLHLAFVACAHLPFWRPIDEMSLAIQELGATRHELKWAQLEIQRCEQLTADGLAAPLAEARDALERILQRRRDAMKTLHALGYRAKMSRSNASQRGDRDPITD